MDCRAYRNWLDEGRPAGLRDDAARHVDACAGCLAERRTADAIDSVLRQRFATAPATILERVMSDLPERESDPGPSIAPTVPEFPDSLPWWSKIFVQPSVILATILAALLLATAGEIRDLGESGAPLLLDWVGGSVSSATGYLESLPATLAIALAAGLIALLAAGTTYAYRSVERL